MNAIYMDVLPVMGTLSFSSTRGVLVSNHGVSLMKQPLSTDPVGIFNLTLLNVVIGSSIQVESQDGSTVFENITALSTTESFVLNTYSAGSTLNELRIKVRKGSSSPYYQPYETLVESVVGSQSIFVSQILDE